MKWAETTYGLDDMNSRAKFVDTYHSGEGANICICTALISVIVLSVTGCKFTDKRLAAAMLCWIYGGTLGWTMKRFAEACTSLRRDQIAFVMAMSFGCTAFGVVLSCGELYRVYSACM